MFGLRQTCSSIEGNGCSQSSDRSGYGCSLNPASPTAMVEDGSRALGRGWGRSNASRGGLKGLNWNKVR